MRRHPLVHREIPVCQDGNANRLPHEVQDLKAPYLLEAVQQLSLQETARQSRSRTEAVPDEIASSQKTLLATTFTPIEKVHPVRNEFLTGFTFFLSVLACFVANFSVAFSQEIKLDLSTIPTEKENHRSLLEIKTSKPVQCIWSYVENSPFLTIDFLEHGIYGSFSKEVVLENGPIKKVKTVYFNDKEEIDFLVLEFNEPSSVAPVFADNFLTLKIDDGFWKTPVVLSPRELEIERALFSARKKIHQEELTTNTPRDISLSDGTRQPDIGAFFGEEAGSLSSGEIPLVENVVCEDEFSRDENLQEVGSNNSQHTQEAGLSLKNAVRQESCSLGEKGLLQDESGSPDNISSENIFGPSRKVEFLNRVLFAGFSEQHRFLVSMVYLLGFILITAAMMFKHKTAGDGGINLTVSRTQKNASGEKIFIEKIQPLSREQNFSATIAKGDLMRQDGENRRRYTRIKIEELKPQPGFKIETWNSQKSKDKCRLKDLSLDGAGFEGSSQLDVPLILQIYITLPRGKPIDICARIVQHNFAREEKKHYGVQFLTITQADRQRLKEYLYDERRSNIC